MVKAQRILGNSNVSRTFRSYRNAELMLRLFLCSRVQIRRNTHKTRILRNENGWAIHFADGYGIPEREKDPKTGKLLEWKTTCEFRYGFEICDSFEIYVESREWISHPEFKKATKGPRFVVMQEKASREESLFGEECHENGDYTKLLMDIIRA